MSTLLDHILTDARASLRRAKATRPLGEVVALARAAPPVRAFKAALDSGFGLIAEIKKKSPSIGAMRDSNVAAAEEAYECSPIVKAFSILTNLQHFGMDLRDLETIRARVTKPVLRKDFIFDEYQVYEARAHGADAILLMACVLPTSEMQRLAGLAHELGMEVLFEAHTLEEIHALPLNARIVGLNSRQFKTSKAHYAAARDAVQHSVRSNRERVRDLSTDLSTFELARHFPATVTKVAESGVTPETVAEVRRHGFDAVLVGTSLLTSPEGPAATLEKFHHALQAGGDRSPVPKPAPSTAGAP